jgi:hypothetical protein
MKAKISLMNKQKYDNYHDLIIGINIFNKIGFSNSAIFNFV